MNYWFKEKLCEFCECWAIAKLLISICIHRWLHLISCETFSKCYRKLWVFRCINFSLLTLSLTPSIETQENPPEWSCETNYADVFHPGFRGKRTTRVKQIYNVWGMRYFLHVIYWLLSIMLITLYIRCMRVKSCGLGHDHSPVLC